MKLIRTRLSEFSRDNLHSILGAGLLFLLLVATSEYAHAKLKISKSMENDLASAETACVERARGQYGNDLWKVKLDRKQSAYDSDSSTYSLVFKGFIDNPDLSGSSTTIDFRCQILAQSGMLLQFSANKNGQHTIVRQ